VFTCAKIITGIDIGLSFIAFLTFGPLNGYIGWFFYSIEPTLILFGSFGIYWACLATEFIGIHKKIQGLVIFNCVIRVIVTILHGIAVIGTLIWVVITHQSSCPECDMGQGFSIMFFVLSVPPLLPYFVFRTWMMFKVLYAVQALNNTTELQPLPPAYNNIIKV
jgi:hypothetical protein